MKKLTDILWNEPIVILAIITGVFAVLAQQRILAAWVPLLVLAIVTPIQRQLAKPITALRKRG